jgi:hypothetical protein
MFVKQNKYIQTEFNMSLTEKELDLLVEIQKLNRKMKKLEKEKSYTQNKISKFIYFFFTL